MIAHASAVLAELRRRDLLNSNADDTTKPPIGRGTGDPMPTQFGPGTLESAAEAGSGQKEVRPDTTNRRDIAGAITATEQRPLARNTLKGFLTPALPRSLPAPRRVGWLGLSPLSCWCRHCWPVITLRECSPREKGLLDQTGDP